MRLEPYRRVLALPGVRSLVLLALLARIPITAIGVTLTLHVVRDLDRGYAAAGLVGAALTVGAALGAPLNGRFVDRRGLRPMLVFTTIAEAIFWFTAPAMSYEVLLATAFVAGLLALPVFSVVRQSLAALVPADQRRQAYALDSMSVELSFMAGPTLAVLLVTTSSGTVALLAIGFALLLSGAALFVTNPPVRPADEEKTDAPPPKRREWLTPRLLVVLAAASATTVVLAGTDMAVIALLRDAERESYVGLVLAVWGAYSLVGGFVYGALPRGVPLVLLLGGLSLFTLPIGLVGGHWAWVMLALLPAGALCAPALSATTEVVSKLVPAGARGEALGWHGSSLTVGLAVGAPLAGAAMDAGSPAWGFAVVGVVGLAVTVLLAVAQRQLALTASSRTSDAAPQPDTTKLPAEAGVAAGAVVAPEPVEPHSRV